MEVNIKQIMLCSNFSIFFRKRKHLFIIVILYNNKQVLSAKLRFEGNTIPYFVVANVDQFI